MVLAAARGTAWLLWDEMTRPWRERRLEKHPPGTKIHKLLTCYWCAGFWASLLTVTFTYANAAWIGAIPWRTWPLVLVVTFATAYGCGWVLDKEQESNVRT